MTEKNEVAIFIQHIKKHAYLYLLCFMALFCSLPLPRGIPLDVITHFMRPSVTKQRKMKQ